MAVKFSQFLSEALSSPSFLVGYNSTTNLNTRVSYADLVAAFTPGTGTVNYISKWTSTSVLANSQIFDDGTSVGIGTTTPEHRLDVNNGKVRFINSSTQEFDLSGQTNLSRLQVNNTWFFLGSLTAHPLVFGTSANERMRIFATGNVGINTGSTDGGQRLQVTGDVLFKGSGNTSGTTALTVQNSDGTNMFTVRNDQNIFITSRTNFGNVQFYPVNNGGYTLSSTATELRMETSFVNGVTTGQFGFALGTYSAHNTSQPNAIGTTINGSFSPTSGTKTYTQLQIDPTINQTGGSNGITIGLRINPTLTAAADWRSIQWANNTGKGIWGVGTADNAMAGSLTVGAASSANASAILDVSSTTKGFLPPRMTSAQMVAIASPATGLVVYDTTNNKLTVYDGTAWVAVH